MRKITSFRSFPISEKKGRTNVRPFSLTKQVENPQRVQADCQKGQRQQRQADADNDVQLLQRQRDFIVPALLLHLPGSL